MASTEGQTTAPTGDSRHLIEIKPSPGKGLGVFAKSHIPCGTRVLAEPCFLGLKCSDKKAADAETVLEKFKKLTNDQKKTYLQLYDGASRDDKREAIKKMSQKWGRLTNTEREVLSIYSVNASPYVFLMGSRINHSCIPNTWLECNKAILKGTFQTIRDIQPGEELLLSYIDGSTWDREKRQQALLERGFLCKCKACEESEFAEAHDEKRKQISQWSAEFKELLNEPDQQAVSKKIIRIARTIVATLTKEHLVGRELCLYFYCLATHHDKLEEYGMARRWTEKGLEVEKYCVGEDNPIFIQMKDTLQQLIEKEKEQAAGGK